VFSVRAQYTSSHSACTDRPLRSRARYRRAVRARARHAWRSGRFPGPQCGQPQDRSKATTDRLKDNHRANTVLVV
jgi:hypothetical protein